VAFVARRGKHIVRVPYADTDKAKVVHHAAYFRFLEMGRVELLREGGLDYRRFEETTDLGLPVVEARLRYRVAARFDDLLEVETQVDQATRASLWFNGVIRRDGIVLLESRVRLACVSFTADPAEALRKIPDAVLDACLEPGWDV
jgi:acyl-CoA thioester hydrolase